MAEAAPKVALPLLVVTTLSFVVEKISTLVMNKTITLTISLIITNVCWSTTRLLNQLLSVVEKRPLCHHPAGSPSDSAAATITSSGGGSCTNYVIAAQCSCLFGKDRWGKEWASFENIHFQ